ncbi:MAG: hypothetical protein O7B99_06780, partial [Planctomycetota bacterium]|nr:hypothetical protein [Planctomycetota bacterium]
MDLRKAYETLGLVRGSSSEEVDAAYERLREEVEARLARVVSPAIEARYREVRIRLDSAREAILAAPASPDEPPGNGFEVLGLPPDASPLDVASAYVALCEEIDRELEDASTEALRWACLEARADVDAAYQRCAASPLRDVGVAAPTTADGEPARYETQMSAEPFEAPEAPEAREPVLRIEPEAPEATSRHRRGRGLRWAAVTLLLASFVTGAVWWSGVDLRDVLDRYVPTAVVVRLAAPGLPVELVEARTTAESLRRRVSEERVELRSRVEQARSRAQEFEASWSSTDDPAERERMA